MQTRRLLAPCVVGLGMALACLCLLASDPARAAVAGVTITVDTTNDELNTDGDCSLREAIQAANTDSAVSGCPAGSGADTIVLPVGIYTLTIAGVDENDNATGDLDVSGSLTISGASAGETIINAAGIDRVLDLRPGAGTVVIAGVTIFNGGVSGSGGGIYSYDADLTLLNMEVFSNAAEYGGGLFIYQGSATLDGGQIAGNTAYEGGGVYIDYGTTVFT